jgi:drug/metabolite transporter (DMT)-like permease
MSRLAPRSRNHFNFNLWQCFWTTIFCLPLAIVAWFSPDLFHGGWDVRTLDARAWVGLFSVTVGSSLIAFFLQVRAQRKLSPTVAALLFLMESPFSAFFAAWFLHEHIGGVQWCGAILIFGACTMASLPKKLAPGAHP